MKFKVGDLVIDSFYPSTVYEVIHIDKFGMKILWETSEGFGSFHSRVKGFKKATNDDIVCHLSKLLKQELISNYSENI